MKRKIKILFAFSSFWFSILLLFCLAGKSDAGRASNGEVIVKGLICIAILAVDVIVINSLISNGDWVSNVEEVIDNEEIIESSIKTQGRAR